MFKRYFVPNDHDMKIKWSFMVENCVQFLHTKKKKFLIHQVC